MFQRTMKSKMIHEITTRERVYQCALKLRYAVFFQKHDLPESVVIDELELHSRHFVLLEKDKLIAYARLSELDDKVFRISQMAVLPARQGQGMGSRLLIHLINEAKKSQAKRIILYARISGIDFYRKHGFENSGDVFLSSSTLLPHQPMSYQVGKITMDKLFVQQFATEWEQSWKNYAALCR